MVGIALLLLVTSLYAGYNLLIKQSSVIAETVSISTITATIVLQCAALVCSLLFYLGLRLSGETEFALPLSAYVWAGLAGICIGVAEIGYFYLYRGSSIAEAMPVSLATPVIVAGSIVIAMIVAMLFFAEPVTSRQWIGVVIVVAGLLLIVR